jgi:hypothetical protein
VDAYGDAVNRGAPAGQTGGADPATAVFTTADGDGYWVASATGQIFSYGDAPNDGGLAGMPLNGSVIAGAGY